MCGTNYITIENYPVKCRLYVNKEQAGIIDLCLAGLGEIYNHAMHDACVNHVNTREVVNEDSVSHFVDFNAMIKAEYLDELRAAHAKSSYIPASALSGKNGLFLNDMKKAFIKTYETTTGKKSTKNATLPVEIIEDMREKNKTSRKKQSVPKYHSRLNPVTSYTYQEALSKVTFKDNPNVIYMDLNKVGDVKIRGFNQGLRFDDGSGELIDFKEYCLRNKKRRITVTILKDTCGDHFIVFKLQNVLKPCKIQQNGEVGVDVGEINPAIRSDGYKYPQMDFKKINKKLDKTQRLISRRQGPKNPEFRKKAKQHKDETGTLLQPSKRYSDTQLKYNKLSRKKTRVRENYYNNISYQLATQYGFVSVETLGDLTYRKDKDRVAKQSKKKTQQE